MYIYPLPLEPPSHPWWQFVFDGPLWWPDTSARGIENKMERLRKHGKLDWQFLEKSKHFFLETFLMVWKQNFSFKINLKQIAREGGRSSLWWIICLFWIKPFWEICEQRLELGLILVEQKIIVSEHQSPCSSCFKHMMYCASPHHGDCYITTVCFMNEFWASYKKCCLAIAWNTL